MNPTLMKIIGKNKETILDVDSEAAEEDANFVATKAKTKISLDK